MFLEIDFSSETPIYEQIRRQIVIGIARGDLQLGEGLPSVRQLGEDLGVNLHTVNKAYKLLQNDGFIVMDRRVGTRVAEKMPNISTEEEESIGYEFKYLISFLKNKNIAKDQIIESVEKIYKGEGGANE